MKQVFLAAVFAMFLNLTGESTMAIEEPKFTVVKSEGDITLREYSSYIVAETQVEGEFDTAGTEGFRRLAGYIFGGNQSTQKIAMTAPVNMTETTSEKIAMTAPVGMTQAEDKTWVITFSMPAQYTLSSLPSPKDPRVHLREIPTRRVAVFEYSGTWSKERFEERKQKLLQWIGDQKLQPAGEATFARYNPPWMPWFLRRNEILIPVHASQLNR